MNFNRNDTAVVVIDPQNEVLSEAGLAWGSVGDSVKENNTVENMERVLAAAKTNGFEVFISPHYFYPTDDGWQFWDARESVEHETGMFARRGALSLDGFTGSGADWLERFKPYIEDGQTVVARLATTSVTPACSPRGREPSALRRRARDAAPEH